MIWIGTWNIGPLPEALMSIPSFLHRAVDINELMSNTKFAGYMFA